MELLTAKENNKIFMKSKKKELQVSSFCYFLYIYFLIDFFLHLSARIPGYGYVRPTLLLVALISISLFMQREKLKDVRKNPVYKAIIILIVYIFISLPLVKWPGSVLKNNLPEFVKAIVFFFFTVFVIDSESRLKKFILVFVGCQVFRVLEPLYLNITQGYWGSQTYLGVGEYANRLAGAPSDIINPNELGFVIATVFPFTYYLLWLGKWKSKILFLILAPLLLYALILTMSRGALIAMLVVAWFIFKESKNKPFLIIVGIVTAIGMWSIMTPDQRDRYLSLVDSDAKQAATAEGRLNGIINEFKIGLEAPVFGHGLGTTPEIKFHLLGRTQAAHNLYAELMMEVGLIGLLIFFYYMISVYKIFKVNRIVADYLPQDKIFYIGLNKALIAVFWMYAIYSINYWGLSVYYWYLFGGLSISFGWLMMKENPGIKEEAKRKAISVVTRAGR